MVTAHCVTVCVCLQDIFLDLLTTEGARSITKWIQGNKLSA